MNMATDIDLLAIPEPEFRSVVDDAIRGHLTEEMAQRLKSPEIVDRTYLTLVSIKKNVEGQLAAKRADYIKSRSLLHDDPRGLRAAEKTYQTWRGGALRFKSGVEEFMVSIRGLREKPGQAENYYIAYQTLKQAIVQHKNHWCGDECLEDCVADETLWTVLADLEEMTTGGD